MLLPSATLAADVLSHFLYSGNKLDHSEMFTLSSRVRNGNSRSSSAGNFYQKNVKKASGAKIWNSIPKNLRKLSKHAFKKQIHINLLLLDLQRQDSYADIDTLINEIKKESS